MSNEVHEYFDSKSSEWNIIDFLKACDEEPFQRKTDKYVKDLKIIINHENGRRQEKAKTLLNRYQKESKPDRKLARKWEQERSQRQIHINQPIIGNENIGNIGNINGQTCNIIMSNKRDKEEDNEETNRTKRAKKSSGKKGDTLPDGTKIEKPNNTPSLDYILISSDSELDNSDEEEGSCLDIKATSFDEYVSQNKKDSKWKLLDGRQLVEVLNSKTSEMVELFLKKDKKEQTLIVKSVIRLGLSSIIDLSSEFENGMYSWFEEDWSNIKKKVYEIVDMKPKGFEEEVGNVIDTIEEMCGAYKYNEARKYLFEIKTSSNISQTLIQIANIYFFVIDKFLKNAFIFVDKSGKCKEISEIEYAIEMIAPIMNEIFNDTSEYIDLRWGETLSNIMSDRRRKIDLRIIRIADKLELSHSECAKLPLPTKIVHDRSKCLRTLKGILNNFLKEDLSDEEVQDSKILGIQFSGLHGQVIGVELFDDGLYFGLEGPAFEFPIQLMNIKCLRSALEALFFFKKNIVEKAKLQADPTKINHPLCKILHQSGSSKAKHFKIKYIRDTYFTPKKRKSDQNSYDNNI